MYNDENTGKHIMRVAAYSELLARELKKEAIKSYIKLYRAI